MFKYSALIGEIRCPMDVTSVPCGHIGEFKKFLTQLREEDDKVIYRLNTSIPTTSFSNKVFLLHLTVKPVFILDDNA